MKRNFLPPYMFFLTILFFIGLLLFTSFRLIFLYVNRQLIPQEGSDLVYYALFNRGLLFDVVVNSYFLIVPFVLLSIVFLISKFEYPILMYFKKFLLFLIEIFLVTFYVFSIACASIDIPYFSYLNSRLTRNVLNWSDDLSTMFKALVNYTDYYPYIALFILLSIVMSIIIHKLYKRLVINSISYSSPVWGSLIIIISAGLLFFGLRGDFRFSHKPINTEHAFFSDNAFVNRIGINPTFNFLDSFRGRKLDYTDDNTAIVETQKNLNVEQLFDSPIARNITFTEQPRKCNVVIVIMESMSANKMKHFGCSSNITPFLDSLSNVSLTFDNVYTAGTHTYNGIFSTLFGMPDLPEKKTMASALSGSGLFSGISNILEGYGYDNLFFCTGNKRFDNMAGFLIPNGFNRIVNQDDYPKEKIENGWGVADHTMFEFSIPILDSIAKQKTPFFAAFMTISAHIGSSVPKTVSAFKPKSKNEADQIYEYSDWAIANFLKSCSAKEWYHNTIFCFIADHGQNFDPTYEMSLAYHHSPLIIYSPSNKLVEPQTNKDLGLQIDVFPTILGKLHLPYVNNTLGIDLLREKRPYCFFLADDKIGCLNQEFFMISRKDGQNSLYSYRKKSVIDVADQHRQLIDSMNTYTFSELQTVQFLIENKKTSLGSLKKTVK